MYSPSNPHVSPYFTIKPTNDTNVHHFLPFLPEISDFPLLFVQVSAPFPPAAPSEPPRGAAAVAPPAAAAAASPEAAGGPAAAPGTAARALGRGRPRPWKIWRYSRNSG